MKITTISYGLTVNTGNHTSARIEMSAQIDEGKETVHDALEALKGAVVYAAEKINPVKGFYACFSK